VLERARDLRGLTSRESRISAWPSLSSVGPRRI
jgi:hypothetical protein